LGFCQPRGGGRRAGNLLARALIPFTALRRLLVLPARPSRFGDAAIVVFLLSQALDGMFTYLGLRQFGAAAEANPLILSVIPVLGQGPAVASAKLFAAMLGVLLHLRGVHLAVALLSGFYIAAAVVPWTLLLLVR